MCGRLVLDLIQPHLGFGRVERSGLFAVRRSSTKLDHHRHPITILGNPHPQTRLPTGKHVEPLHRDHDHSLGCELLQLLHPVQVGLEGFDLLGMGRTGPLGFQEPHRPAVHEFLIVQPALVVAPDGSERFLRRGKAARLQVHFCIGFLFLLYGRIFNRLPVCCLHPVEGDADPRSDRGECEEHRRGNLELGPQHGFPHSFR
jgi:hypothetical protein